MYERFYRLASKPFSLLSNPDFLWLGEQHRTALSMLEYGLVNQAGFVVITGEPGTGKTTLLHKLLADHRRRFVVGTISNTPNDIQELMPWILAAFNLKPAQGDRVQAYQTFSSFLQEQAAKQHRVLLIVDEAQNLGVQLLEELRLLSNLNDSKTQMLQIILSGQPDLRRLLQRSDLKQFAQRIVVDYHLVPLTADDLPTYVLHRTQVAGAARPLFTERACRVIYAITGGVPRLVNQICDASLAYGFAEQAPVITAQMAAKAGLDRGRGGLLPECREADILALTQDSRWSDRIDSGALNATAAPQQDAQAARTVGADADHNTIYETATQLRKEGHNQEAIDHFRRLTASASHALQAYTQIGLCLRALARPAEAVIAFRKALNTPGAKDDPRQIDVYFMLGRTLEELQRTAESVTAYRRVVQLDPQYKDVAERLQTLTAGHHSLRPTGTESSGIGQTLRQTFRRIFRRC
ncbi:MAG: AAA family ATPase [Nitrospiraceae bacterium]